MMTGSILLGTFFSSGLLAVEQASSGLGERLFNDSGLGSSVNERSCNTCHVGGKGLEKAGHRSDLPSMINICIQGALQGRSISEDSVEMRSLVIYIRSL